MTIAESEMFYKKDKKEYIPIQNEEFLNWYGNQLKAGITFYLNLDEMQELIEKIITWYEIKIPSHDFANMKQQTFEDMPNLGEVMSIDQLRYRLEHQNLETLDCNCRTGMGIISSSGEHMVCMAIKKKNTEENKFDEVRIKATAVRGLLNGWCEDDIDAYLGVETENSDIRTLLKLFEQKVSAQYDYSELKHCVEINEADIKLRYFLINMVFLGLLYSKNTSPEQGLCRARRCALDFNSYYGLNLTTDYLDEIMAVDYSFKKDQQKKKKRQSEHNKNGQ